MNSSGYNIGSIPTPPWKTNNNINIHSTSNFPGFTSTNNVLPSNNPTSYEDSMRVYQQDYLARNNALAGGGYGGAYNNDPKDNVSYGAVSSQQHNYNNSTSSSLHHNGVGGGSNFPVYGQRDGFYESEHLAGPKDNINNHNNQPTKLTNFESSKGDQGYNRNEQNQIPAKQPPPVNPSPKDPSPKNPPKSRPTDQEDQELERKALAAEITQEFYAKIKPLSLMQLAADVALKHARQEYYTKIKKTCPEKPSGSGHYTCDMCYVNFLTKEKLNMHNNGAGHRELEDLYSLKKEQARLIMEKKIKGPTPPKLDMKPLPEAEAETNLKATDLDLDVYILGIYESVMKPYWPVPNSQFYCRMCNYLEFNTEANLVHHNNTSEHMKREATYEEAFCLYCQRHYYNKQQLSTHVNTSKHEQIKDLMERTKEAATQRWHKLNAPTSSGDRFCRTIFGCCII